MCSGKIPIGSPTIHNLVIGSHGGFSRRVALPERLPGTPDHDLWLRLKRFSLLNEFGQIGIKVTDYRAKSSVALAEHHAQSRRRKLCATFPAQIADSLLNFG